MKRWQVILIIVLVVASFLGGYHCNSVFNQKLITELDTITRFDTIRDSIPYPVYETVIELVPEVFTEYVTIAGDTVHDTIMIDIPHVQREYMTKNYRVFVSGYKPNLDSIEIYRQTEYVTRTIEIQPRRFGVGVIGGYGVGIHGLSPYIGIGGFYRIW